MKLRKSECVLQMYLVEELMDSANLKLSRQGLGHHNFRRNRKNRDLNQGPSYPATERSPIATRLAVSSSIPIARKRRF